MTATFRYPPRPSLGKPSPHSGSVSRIGFVLRTVGTGEIGGTEVPSKGMGPVPDFHKDKRFSGRLSEGL